MLRKYSENWDKKIKEWYSDPSGYFEDDILYKKYLGKEQRKLNKLALPEPYLGDINGKCSIVVLSLNPGNPLKDGEQLHPNGYFIEDGAIECYSNWAKRWVYLNEVENPHWNNRKKWIESRVEDTNYQPFGIELIPYHSKKYGSLFKDEATLEYLEKNVYQIAEEKLKDSSYNAIVAFGAEHYRIMERLNFELIFEVNEENVEGELKEHWPIKKNGKLTNRTYSVWRSERGSLYFQTHYSGGFSSPSRDFLKVERYIEERYISEPK